MTENWVLFAAIVAVLIYRLARLAVQYRTTRRRDQIKAGRS
jgi:hypothetical protein